MSDEKVNNGKQIPFDEAEETIRNIILNSNRYNRIKRNGLTKTLHHELGHARATIKNKQSLCSMRIGLWFIYFYENNSFSVWTLDYLYKKYAKEQKSSEFKEYTEMIIKNPMFYGTKGDIFMKIDTKLYGENLSDTLTNILEADGRNSIASKFQWNKNSDRSRKKKIKKEHKKGIYTEAESIREYLNSVCKGKLNDNMSGIQKIHIYGIKTVKIQIA